MSVNPTLTTRVATTLAFTAHASPTTRPTCSAVTTTTPHSNTAATRRSSRWSCSWTSPPHQMDTHTSELTCNTTALSAFYTTQFPLNKKCKKKKPKNNARVCLKKFFKNAIFEWVCYRALSVSGTGQKKWFNIRKLKATLFTMAPLPLTQVNQLAWYRTMNFAGCLLLVALTHHHQQPLSGYKKLVSSLISVCSRCQRHQRGQRRCWRRLEGEEEG